MSCRLLSLVRGIAVLLPLLGTPAAWAGLICDDSDGGARFTTELALNAYLAELGLDAVKDRIALARARSGDNGLSGVWEIGLSGADAKADAPADGGAQFRWSKSEDSSWVSFSLTRRDDRLSFTVGKTMTTYLDPRISEITALALFASADGRDDQVRLQNLSMDGTRLREIELSAEDGLGDGALLDRLRGNFSLVGEVRMRWEDVLDGKDPNRLMFQLAGYGPSSDEVLATGGGVSSGLAAAIPEPASAMILAAGLLGLVGQVRLRTVRRARAMLASRR